MSSEAGHIQITEFNKEVIPMINWMMEDLFCQYGVSLPWFMCNFKFPDFSQRPDWVSGYNFNLDWGEWGYWLVKFNELLGLLWDEAHLPRLTLPDLSPGSWAFFNDYTEILYDNMQRHYIYDQSGTFTKDEVIEGEDSGVVGYYKWKDGDGYIHVANKQDASGESVADFEEEKIVGADSGAYAWTYEDYSWSQTFNAVDLDPSQLFRRGWDYTAEDAWDMYFNNPDYLIQDFDSIYWACVAPVVALWLSYGMKCYLEFDTSEANADGNSLIFRVTISSLIRTGAASGTQTLQLYKQDFGDAVDTGDWTGGELVGEVEFSSTGTKTITLDPSVINVGGTSKFRLTLKDMEDDNVYSYNAFQIRFDHSSQRLIWSFS